MPSRKGVDRDRAEQDAFAPPQPRLAVIVAAMAAFVVAGASAAWCFPWSIDMFRGPAIQPLEVSPRVMPEGTLPIDTGTPPQDLEQATIKAHNPLKPTPENIAHGKELFTNTCTPCHGESGHGDGPVAHLLHAHGYDPKNLVTGDEQEPARRLYLWLHPRRRNPYALVRRRDELRRALGRGDVRAPVADAGTGERSENRH